MEQEGEEEEAAADRCMSPAVHSASRCWYMLDCSIGYRRRSNSAEASFLYAIVVGEYVAPFRMFWVDTLEESRYAAVMPRAAQYSDAVDVTLLASFLLAFAQQPQAAAFCYYHFVILDFK